MRFGLHACSNLLENSRVNRCRRADWSEIKACYFRSQHTPGWNFTKCKLFTTLINFGNLGDFGNFFLVGPVGFELEAFGGV